MAPERSAVPDRIRHALQAVDGGVMLDRVMLDKMGP
jgi:hypothetical protein